MRITFDGDIRTGLNPAGFLDKDAALFPAPDRTFLLEVKYDDFLPGVIAEALQTGTLRVSSFSKYAACRAYE